MKFIVGNRFDPVNLSGDEWAFPIFTPGLIYIYEAAYIAGLWDNLVFHSIFIDVVHDLPHALLRGIAYSFIRNVFYNGLQLGNGDIRELTCI